MNFITWNLVSLYPEISDEIIYDKHESPYMLRVILREGLQPEFYIFFDNKSVMIRQDITNLDKLERAAKQIYAILSRVN